MLVRATQTGHYGDKLRAPGEEFEISDDAYTEADKEAGKISGGKEVGDIKAFSTRWMEDPTEVEPEDESPKEKAINRGKKHHKANTSKYGEEVPQREVI